MPSSLSDLSAPVADEQILKGFIAEDAATPDSEINVLLPAYDLSRQFGPSTFQPRPLLDGSVMLPARNDPCLVALDEHDNAHILTWWASDPTSDANRVTQAEFDALGARVGAIELGLPVLTDYTQIATVFPAPVAGDEFYFRPQVSGAGTEILWRFRYTDSSLAWPWLYIGGNEWEVSENTNFVTASTTLVAPTNPVEIPVPLNGVYILGLGGECTISTVMAQAVLAYNTAGVNTESAVSRVLFTNPNATSAVGGFRRSRISLARGVLGIRVRAGAGIGAGNATFAAKQISITPVRINNS